MKDNTKKRFITGAILFVVFASVIMLTLKVHWVFFDILIFLLALMAAYEICNAIRQKYPAPMRVFVYSAIVLGYVAYIIAQRVFDIGGITMYFAVLLVLSMTMIIFSLCSKKATTNNVIATMFVFLYPVSALLYTLGINHFEPHIRAVGILLLFTVSTFTDMFAYFVGSTVKGKKLCPKISPNKTVSGAIGGLLGGRCDMVLCVAYRIGSFFRNGSAFRRLESRMVGLLIGRIVWLVSDAVRRSFCFVRKATCGDKRLFASVAGTWRNNGSYRRTYV